MSTSGNTIIATIRKGTYAISNYALYIDGEAQSGISISGSGIIDGYTLNGTESAIKLLITDAAGYTDVAELHLTPTVVVDPEEPESGN